MNCVYVSNLTTDRVRDCRKKRDHLTASCSLIPEGGRLHDIKQIVSSFYLTDRYKQNCYSSLVPREEALYRMMEDLIHGVFSFGFDIGSTIVIPDSIDYKFQFRVSSMVDRWSAFRSHTPLELVRNVP